MSTKFYDFYRNQVPFDDIIQLPVAAMDYPILGIPCVLHRVGHLVPGSKMPKLDGSNLVSVRSTVKLFYTSGYFGIIIYTLDVSMYSPCNIAECCEAIHSFRYLLYLKKQCIFIFFNIER